MPVFNEINRPQYRRTSGGEIGPPKRKKKDPEERRSRDMTTALTADIAKAALARGYKNVGPEQIAALKKALGGGSSSGARTGYAESRDPEERMRQRTSLMSEAEKQRIIREARTERVMAKSRKGHRIEQRRVEDRRKYEADQKTRADAGDLSAYPGTVEGKPAAILHGYGNAEQQEWLRSRIGSGRAGGRQTGRAVAEKGIAAAKTTASNIRGAEPYRNDAEKLYARQRGEGGLTREQAVQSAPVTDQNASRIDVLNRQAAEGYAKAGGQAYEAMMRQNQPLDPTAARAEVDASMRNFGYTQQPMTPGQQTLQPGQMLPSAVPPPPPPPMQLPSVPVPVPQGAQGPFGTPGYPAQGPQQPGMQGFTGDQGQAGVPGQQQQAPTARQTLGMEQGGINAMPSMWPDPNAGPSFTEGFQTQGTGYTAPPQQQQQAQALAYQPPQTPMTPATQAQQQRTAELWEARNRSLFRTGPEYAPGGPLGPPAAPPQAPGQAPGQVQGQGQEGGFFGGIRTTPAEAIAAAVEKRAAEMHPYQIEALKKSVGQITSLTDDQQNVLTGVMERLPAEWDTGVTFAAESVATMLQNAAASGGPDAVKFLASRLRLSPMYAHLAAQVNEGGGLANPDAKVWMEWLESSLAQADKTGVGPLPESIKGVAAYVAKLLPMKRFNRMTPPRLDDKPQQGRTPPSPMQGTTGPGATGGMSWGQFKQGLSSLF